MTNELIAVAVVLSLALLFGGAWAVRSISHLEAELFRVEASLLKVSDAMQRVATEHGAAIRTNNIALQHLLHKEKEGNG